MGREKWGEERDKWGEERGEHTSFNCLTFPMIPSTCPSFWLSNSFNTASLY